METSGRRVGQRERYFVPDLTPRDRMELRALRPWVVFVGESPHLSEVAPERKGDRRPLCGAAGRQWWSLLSELLEGRPDPDVSLERILGFSARHGIAVMNSVQYPLDPKIAAVHPQADPLENLGFSKAAGELGYKRRKGGAAVRSAIGNLRRRLSDRRIGDAAIWCLGNDSEWFVRQALDGVDPSRLAGKVPHPSAWWRQGGLFGRIAREKLGTLLERAPRPGRAA